MLQPPNQSECRQNLANNDSRGAPLTARQFLLPNSGAKLPPGGRTEYQIIK